MVTNYSLENHVGNTATPYGPAILSGDDVARHAITAGLRAHQELIFKFTQAWYASPYTFRTTKVLGYDACKIPFDLWIFHDLMMQYRFQTVVETGTASGGAALWFAVLMDLLKIDGVVHTIDVDSVEVHGDRPVHPRIVYHHGNSTDPELVELIATDAQSRGGHLLVDLDSDHHAPHVLQELELWAPLVPVGSWLVVEDTNGSPVETDPDTGAPVMVEGPFAAVMEYLQRHPGEFLRDVVCERFMITMNPHGWLQRKAACAHD